MHVKYWLRKLEIWPGVDPKVEMSARIEHNAHLLFVLVCISLSHNLFLMLQWMITAVSFLKSLYFYYLMVPRSGGCSFYFMSVLGLFIPTFSKKKKKTPNPEKWTDWQALLLLSAIFKQHGRITLLESVQLKRLCLTISHFSTSLFYFFSCFIKG